MRKSEKRYRELIENIDQGIFRVDANGVLTFLSPAVTKTLGYSPKMLLGVNFADLIHPDDLPRVLGEFNEALSGHGFLSEYRVRHASGDYHWIQSNSKALYDGDRVVGVQGIFSDVTPRRRSEEALKESEERYRTMVEESFDAVFIHNGTYIVFANQQAHEMLGYEPGALIGLDFKEFSTQESYEIMKRRAEARLQGAEAPSQYEVNLVRLDGSTFEAEIRVRVITLVGRKFIQAWVRDISERKKAEEALKASEAKYRMLVQHAPSGIYEVDLVTPRFLSVNEVMCEYTGYTEEEFLNLSPFDLLIEESVAVFAERLEKMEKGETPEPNFEAKVKGKNGQVIWVLINSSYFFEGGRPVRAMVVVHDITERKRVENALRESEEKFATAFRSNPGAISLSRISDGKYVDVNHGFTAMYGWTPEEVVGVTVHDLEIPVDMQQWTHRDRLLSKYGTIREFEFNFRRKNGEIGTALNSAGIIEIGGLPHLLSISQDITRRKQAEEEASRLAAAVRHAAEDFMITDTEGTILYVNPAFERLTGYTKEEVLGKNPRFLKSGRHGREFYRELWETIDSGRVWNGRITNRKKDGGLIELEATISPIFDRQGIVTGYVSAKRDITEQIKLETQLRQSQKMEALGALAGGIAHDFNNILTIILGYTQMAQGRDQIEEVKDDVSRVMTAGLRAMDLVKRILTFSRQTEQERQPVDLRDIIEESLKFLRPSLPSTIEIISSITARRATVLADPTQVHQILMNLCTNAFQAMSENGGRLELGLREIDVEEIDASMGCRIPRGPYLLLTVSDTGRGMSPEILDRIFDPYFTTKGIGEGTGLGLAMVHGIVKSHGGVIRVYSEEGQGSAFHVYLPSIVDEVQAAAETETSIPGGSETILFVDDEEALAEIGKEMLEILGYRVEVFTSSLEALKAFRAAPERFDLIVTDLIMPQMTGLELAGEVMRVRSQMPIIICTGFSTAINRRKAQAMGIDRYILKPYLIREMAQAVREVLDIKQAGLVGGLSSSNFE